MNTIRALFAQQPVGSDIWIALAWLRRHPRRRLRLRDRDLPSQDQLIWDCSLSSAGKERPMRSSNGRSYIPVGDVGFEGEAHEQIQMTFQKFCI